MTVETQSSIAALPDGFDDFFRQNIEPDLAQAEALRRKSVPVIQAFAGVFILGIIGFVSVIFIKDSDLPMILAVVGISVVLMFVGAIGCSKAYGRVRAVLKNKLVGPICNYMGMDFDSEAGDFAFHRFTDAGLVSSKYDNAEFEDHISGEHNGVRFALCEAKLTKNRAGGDEDGSSTITLFEGVALVFSFPKPFRGLTQVLARGGFVGAKHPGEPVRI